MPYFFRKFEKISQKLSSAAVVVGALRVNSLPTGSFCTFLSSADFFQNQLFFKNSFSNSIRVSISLIQIRPDILPGLIWVQTICKGHQQTTLVGTEF